MPVLFSTIIYKQGHDDDFDYDLYDGEDDDDDGHLGHSHGRIGEEGAEGKAGEHCDCRRDVLHMVFLHWESNKIVIVDGSNVRCQIIWEILKC